MGRWSETMEKLRLWRDDWRVFLKKTDPKTDRRTARKNDIRDSRMTLAITGWGL